MAIPFKIQLNNAAINFGDPESPYTALTAKTIASVANWVVPLGVYFVVGDGAAAQLEVSANAANATPTWTQVAATGYAGPGPIYSDGNSWRVLNSATTAITIHYFQVT